MIELEYQDLKIITGNSNWQGDAEIINLLHLYRPKTILDIGVGKWAKMGYLARRSYEDWIKIHEDSNFKLIIEGIEVWQPNIEFIRCNFPRIYDEIKGIHIFEMLEFFDSIRYDVIVFGDVLEHFTKDAGIKLFKYAYEYCNKAVIIQIPIGNYEQIKCDNPFEIHLHNWNREEIKDLDSCFSSCKEFIDISGREFLVLSKAK